MTKVIDFNLHLYCNKFHFSFFFEYFKNLRLKGKTLNEIKIEHENDRDGRESESARMKKKRKKNRYRLNEIQWDGKNNFFLKIIK